MKVSYAIIQIFPLLKAIFFLSWVYILGIVKGVLFGIVFHHLYLVIMNKLFHLEPFSPGDRLFIFPPEEEMYNLLGYLIFDDEIDIDKVKECIIERGIKVYKKLRCVQNVKFFDFWWKEMPLEKCLTSLSPIKVKENETKFDTMDDLITYSYEEIPKRFKLDQDLPYSFTIIKNNEGKYRNLIILKVHHSISDGLGFIGVITALGENYSLKLFPQSMKKARPSIIQVAISFMMFPYYLILPFFQHFFTLKSGPTPFKSEKKKTGLPMISISQQYDFVTFSKINKKLGITFNDMMMTAFSAAIKAYCKEHYPLVPEKVITINPISNRGLPSDPKNLIITNDSSGIGCFLNLIDDPLKDVDIVAKEYKFKLRNIYLAKITKFASDLCNTVGPYFLTKLLYGYAYHHCDILFSNVALPKEPLVYNGSKITEIYPLMAPMNCKSFIGIYSYNGKFSCTICADRCLDMDPKVLMKSLEEQLNYILIKGSEMSKSD